MRQILDSFCQNPDTWPASVHVYKVHPRNNKRDLDLISDALPFGRLWYAVEKAASNAL